MRGSILVATAILVAIFAIFMSGVLTYISNEYRLNFRSHQFAQSLYLAEAAVELGMNELLYRNSFNATNGWVNLGDGSYTKTINLTDTAGNFVGILSNRVYAGITPITITGIGSATNTIGGLANTERAVSVVLSASSLFKMALVAKSPFSFSGNIRVDSYDSSDPTKSTGGFYDAAKAGDDGNVATTAGTVAFPSGSPIISGTVETGPGGTMTMAGGSLMGPTNAANQIGPGAVPQAVANGWLRADFSSAPPDVTVPATLKTASNLGTINLSSSGTQTINAGAWQVNALSIANAATLTINGTVSLYILGNVTVANGGAIKIPTGSALTVYVGGPTMNLSGAGVIHSIVQPVKDEWFGLPTLTTATFQNGTSFIGAFYAPDTAVSVLGNAQIYGSMIGSNIVLGGSAGVHFDDSLKSGGSGGGGNGYSIASWREMRKVNGIWQ